MTFSPDDESTWRVTPESPVREVDGMDWERCAALHNLIVRLGWTGIGNEQADMPRETWWQKHITNEALHEEWSRRLSPSLKLFLQSALQTPHENFFYYVSCLSFPDGLFVQDYEEEDKKMTLYRMTNLNFAGHRDGLNFDQNISRAIFCDDILDSRIVSNGRTEWDPLEEVLSQWLNMIDTGKVIVSPNGTPSKGPWETAPWELVPYSQSQLQHAVNGFDNLIIRLECLLENPSLKTLDNPKDQAKLTEACVKKFSVPVEKKKFGLVEKEVLDAAGIPEGTFIRDFFSSVRKPSNPSIRYLAPGLRLPTAQDFSPHPFQNFVFPANMDKEEYILPYPLFISDLKSTEPLLNYPFLEPNLPYGVWISDIWKYSHHIFEDSFRLYLPFEIGANGFARLTDDSLIGENQESPGETGRGSGKKNDLYQPGYCHFIPGHETSLGDLLEVWSNMVGAGEWEVGEEGVKGGIEKFKDADTEEHYFKYQILAVKW